MAKWTFPESSGVLLRLFQGYRSTLRALRGRAHWRRWWSVVGTLPWHHQIGYPAKSLLLGFLYTLPYIRETCDCLNSFNGFRRVGGEKDGGVGFDLARFRLQSRWPSGEWTNSITSWVPGGSVGPTWEEVAGDDCVGGKATLVQRPDEGRVGKRDHTCPPRVYLCRGGWWGGPCVQRLFWPPSWSYGQYFRFK